jgi:hypothetical protein
MFSSLVSGAVEPELVKIVKAALASLDVVRMRLEEQTSDMDPITVLAARQQLKALDAWTPGLADFLARLQPGATE